jgi:hypothetical protein
VLGLERAAVVAIERACTATRHVENVPGWNRIYPQCLFARWSADLDTRWNTGVWSPHDDYDEWSEWFDNLTGHELSRGHWHNW